MRLVPKSSIGVLLADDSATICKLILQLLQKERSIHVVGVTGTLDDTLYLAAEYTPDVLLLDLHLDDLAAHDPLRIKIALLSCVRHVIGMSTRSDEEERQLAQSYGASRLVDKFFLSEQLVASIRSCSLHKRPMAPPHRHYQPKPLSRFAS
jgi:DNA-binding NarL/FixJ family response regulator